MQSMETKNELQLVSNMIMCGDHPSITKTELNAKEPRRRDDDKDKPEEARPPPLLYGRLSPTSSQTDKPCARTASELAVRALAARRRARSLDLPERDDDVHGNRALVQAAIGSFRWPPYLLCVWVLVLVLTHALHGLVAVLDRALPTLRKMCQYCRSWAESELSRRVSPRALALAGGTGTLYALYAALCALHAAALWAVEPLCADSDPLAADLPRVINYDEINTKDSLNAKQ